MRKLWLSCGLVAVIAIVYFFTPARHYLSQEDFIKLQTWIQNLGFLAPLVFGLIYVMATVFALPGSVLTIGGGLIFGTAWGTLINLIAATIGAMAAFLVARYLGREFVARRLSGRLAHLDGKMEQHGFLTVLYLRLIPLFPFNILNYSLGLTRLRFRDYFLATLLGMAPACFVYSSLGGVGRYIEWTNPQTWSNYKVWGPFALVLLLSIIVYLVKRWRKPMMRPKLLLLIAFLLSSSVWAEERVEYYRELTPTLTRPYHFEGLWPVLEPSNQAYYQFIYDESEKLLEITHFNEKGEIANNKEGWARYELSYDEQGRFAEGAFYYHKAGRMILRKKLKTLQNNLGIEPGLPIPHE